MPRWSRVQMVHCNLWRWWRRWCCLHSAYLNLRYVPYTGYCSTICWPMMGWYTSWMSWQCASSHLILVCVWYRTLKQCVKSRRGTTLNTDSKCDIVSMNGIDLPTFIIIFPLVSHWQLTHATVSFLHNARHVRVSAALISIGERVILELCGICLKSHQVRFAYERIRAHRISQTNTTMSWHTMDTWCLMRATIKAGRMNVSNYHILSTISCKRFGYTFGKQS